MKKYDEGYVLAYVTVVLLLFCLIATMILTGAMKNLTIQQDTVQHMKDRYAAEGMIQQVIAKRSNTNFAEGKELDGPNLVCDAVDGNLITVSATCKGVRITCQFDKTTGEYKSFEIGTAPEQSEAGEGEVAQ